MWNHKRLQCPLATYLSTAHYYILLDGGIREICTAIYCQNAFITHQVGYSLSMFGWNGYFPHECRKNAGAFLWRYDGIYVTCGREDIYYEDIA